MAGVTIASTWDKEAIYQRGYNMGKEFKGKGVNIGLLPVCGPLGKNPEGGRYTPSCEISDIETGKVSHLIRIWPDGQ
jgi:hypothetical protein